ncbi:MAG: hypothetical protein JRE40_11240 [Deltaproteobacteria bacterium]|nr:hypothetical protein [Deltaproteobacteria bacterium]
MQITEAEARRAGEISQKFALSDKELALLVKSTKIVVAFLEGKGQGWSLALSPLRQELEKLEGFVRARKRDR